MPFVRRPSRSACQDWRRWRFIPACACL